MIITINQLTDYYKQFAEAHEFLKDFGYGSMFDIGSSKEMKFPYLWVTHSGSSTIRIAPTKQQIPELSLSFIVVDQWNNQENYLDVNGYDSNNAQEIMSDSFQTCQDIILYTNTKLNSLGIKIEGDASIDPVLNETEDKVFGWKLDLRLKLIHSNCTLPGDFNNIPVTVGLCPAITVKNSDGSYTVQAPSGQTFNLPDISVNVNNELFDSVPSVQDVNILVKDTDGVLVGSKVGSDWIVPKVSNERIYIRPQKTGQTVSYAVWDDAWKLANNVDTYLAPINGNAMNLELNDRYKVTYANEFGNYFRWTGLSGGYYDYLTSQYKDVDGVVTTKALAFPNDYLIDHHTGLGWKLTQSVTNATWTNALTDIDNLVHAGYNDYFMPTVTEILTLFSYWPIYAQAKPPFDWLNSNKWLSTTITTNVNGAYALSTTSEITLVTKTTGLVVIAMRYHYK